MRSILRNLLLASLALAFPFAPGCSGDTTNPLPNGGGFGTDVNSSNQTGFPSDTGSGGFESSGSTPVDRWVRTYGDAADQKAGALAVNEAGDIAVTGSARGTIDFGNIPWTGSTTDSDVFVARISRQSQSLWSRRYGDSCDQHGGATAFTPAGDVLIAGDFCGKMDFGKTTVEAPAGEVDIFVAVIDDIGEDIYSRRIGGAGPQIARAAAVDAKGNALLVGSFQMAFDDGSGTVASAGLDDAFVIKLDPTGKVLWSRRFGGAEADIARAVAVDQDGTVIVGGSFGGALDFGGGPVVVPVGHSSAFVTALDPDGKHLWSHIFTGDDEAVVNGLAVEPSGMVAAIGSFAGTADLGSGPTTSAGAEDVLLALINSDGKPIWGRAFGGPKSQIGTGVGFGTTGDVVISSTSQEPIDFGNDDVFPISPPLLPELLYLARFTAAGNLIAGRVLGSIAPFESVGIGCNGTSGSVLAGSFQKTLEPEVGAIQSAGGWDVLVSRSE